MVQKLAAFADKFLLYLTRKLEKKVCPYFHLPDGADQGSRARRTSAGPARGWRMPFGCAAAAGGSQTGRTLADAADTVVLQVQLGFEFNLRSAVVKPRTFCAAGRAVRGPDMEPGAILRGHCR